MGSVASSYANFSRQELVRDCDTPEKFAAFVKEHFPEDADMRERILARALVGERLLAGADAEALELCEGTSGKFRSWVAHLRAAPQPGVAASLCSCDEEAALPAAPDAAATETVVSQPAKTEVEV